MGTPVAKRPRRKPAGRYHHGDLRRALIDQALRTIDSRGVDALTLRDVATALGVSRTALYRHFADKQALVAAVAREGFRTFRIALSQAWERHERTRAAFDAMGTAYLDFAIAHPAHYRVMFGRFADSCERDPELIEEATAAFQVLVDALVQGQRDGWVRKDDPEMLARFIWSVSHGIAMLVIDGQLPDGNASGAALNQFASARLHAAIGPR